MASRDSTSLDKDLTRLRKGLEEDSAVDLQGEAHGGLAEGRSEGQEELAGGVELSWGCVELGIIVMAGEGVCGSEGRTDEVLDETGNPAAPEEVSPPADSNSSSSFASKSAATDRSSALEASGP